MAPGLEARPGKKFRPAFVFGTQALSEQETTRKFLARHLLGWLRSNGGRYASPSHRIECNRRICDDPDTAGAGRAGSPWRTTGACRHAIRKAGIGRRTWSAFAIGHSDRTGISV
jgi:hypothetical protein